MSQLDEYRRLYKQRLAEMLLEVVRERSLSGRQLAELAGINAGSMRAYLVAETFPTKENREKIASGVFRISLEELDAKIERRPVKRQSKVDDVCREIRLMDDVEFLAVYEEVSRQVPERFGGSVISRL